VIYHSAKDKAEGDGYHLHDLAAEVSLTLKHLRPNIDLFDVIVVTGLSGILPAVPVAMRLKVPLAILRKPGDDSHQWGGEKFSGDGSRWVNGDVVRGNRALWIDDFSCGGGTRNRMRGAVTELGGRVVAEYLTRHQLFVPWTVGQPRGDYE
jgi:adenine/guanine phosphoribosyltransferase-like PRPP-binding protein